jgi:hypothetical protein
MKPIMAEIQTVLPPLAFFELRVQKSSETSPEAMAACFQALPKIKTSFWGQLRQRQEALSLEIVAWNQRLYFMAAVPQSFASHFTSQLVAQYPQALITPVGDYLPYFFPENTPFKDQMEAASFGQLSLEKPFYLPLKTYADFKDIDPLSTILGTLAKAHPETKILVQFLINAAAKNWQAVGQKIAQTPIPTSDPERVMPHPQKAVIEQKIAQVAFQVGIRLMVVGREQGINEVSLSQLAGSFASLAHGDGNSLGLTQPHFWQKTGFFQSLFKRSPTFVPANNILTASEIATLYHLPNLQLAAIKNIAWGGTLKGEPPEELPIAVNLSEEEKRGINFFARTEFKNQETVFGIKKIDRRKHLYIVGKTGTGKSTLIANMAINDMRNGEGLAIVDPHGDLIDIVLDYIPSYRLNDLVYLDPTRTDAPFRLNPLEVASHEQADLVASGIVAIFHKLFGDSWGPRLEYILRNTVMTLTQLPGTTIPDILKLLSDSAYRKRVVEKLADPTLAQFWIQEYDKYPDRFRQEAIAPIQNKVGQFVTSPKIRAVLERPHSSVNLDEVMNSGKILLLNLSQGKLGEDNSTLLGAMLITKMQSAAMNRAHIPEAQRRDFFLYVDEFQNFATRAFIKILSEARKYRLNLTVANQYTSQVEEEIQKAIFGNVGSLMSFNVGSADARLLALEYGSNYEEADLVGLDDFTAILKLSIDNKTSTPFPCKTLPLPRSKNKNREKAIRISVERYGRPDKE